MLQFEGGVGALGRRPPLGQTDALATRVEVLAFNKYLLVIRNVLSLSSKKELVDWVVQIQLKNA